MILVTRFALCGVLSIAYIPLCMLAWLLGLWGRWGIKDQDTFFDTIWGWYK